MPSVGSANTQYFKQLKQTSQKSILSYGTPVLQKHLSFIESSALTQPPVCNKGTTSAWPFLLLPSSCKYGSLVSIIYIQGQIWPKCVVSCIGGDPRTMLSSTAIVRNGLSSVGLEINNSKCELLVINLTTSTERLHTSKFFYEKSPSISTQKMAELDPLWIRNPAHCT